MYDDVKLDHRRALNTICLLTVSYEMSAQRAHLSAWWRTWTPAKWRQHIQFTTTL